MSSKGTHRRRRLRGPVVIATVLGASGLVALLGPGLHSADAAELCNGRKARTLHFRTGEVRVYRDKGYVCAVAVADRAGTPQAMSVTVQARGSAAVADKGTFKYHAGPVKVHAGHRCVWVRGKIGNKSVSSGWILC
ncbi:hypothetical protein [Streptomyces physcomitrii]|uniref:hypothetical protein n=1 Tax=Streptomyces physcomitrii TaxID=2724184 RepID=UPI0028A7DBCA|nr:hypothetical protein [Streptomyces physcomitrii]